MMKHTIAIVVTLLICVNCQQKPEDKKIYKTKGGEYASKEGNFIVKFPLEPTYTVIDNQIGTDKYQINIFQSKFGTTQIFTVEYIDFPAYVFDSWETQEYYEKTIETIVNRLEGAYKLLHQRPIEQHGLKGQYFLLELNPDSPKSKRLKGSFEGKIFKIDNRVYTIQFVGVTNQKTDPFMDSFRLIN